MKEIQVLRDTVARLAQKSVGLHTNVPRYYSGNAVSQMFGNQVMQYPALSTMSPIQDLNPSSPTFGKFYFMVGFSIVGGPDIVG